MTASTLLFILICVLILFHYVLVFFSTKLNIKPRHIEGSAELVRLVVAAWVGSVIGVNL